MIWEKMGPESAAAFVVVEDVRAGDVGGHQVGGELNPLELDIKDAGDRADGECFGEAGHTDEKAMSAGEDGGENLLDDGALADDDLLELIHHELAVLTELFEELVEVALFAGHGGCSLRGRNGESLS